MKGDFSRLTFDPLRGFSRVLTQQGRVTLDADLNEQSAILLHLMRTLGADLIGEHGGPANSCAFRLIRAEDINTDTALDDTTKRRLRDAGILPLKDRDALFSPGHYYVDGWLADVADYVSYVQQPFLPAPDDIGEGGPRLVYLDVWERHVTMLEDNSLREVALGGSDTATRAQVVWQLKVLSRAELPDNVVSNIDSCANFPLKDFRKFLTGRRPRLKARAKEDVDSDAPCAMPAEAHYRGYENQLYRVEIHSKGKVWTEEALTAWKKAAAKAKKEKNPLPPVPEGLATFKWSRENGSVVVPWLKTEGNDLVVSGIRDRARGFSAGDWIELSDAERTLRGGAGVMVQLVSVEGETLTVDPATASGKIDDNPSQEKHAQVRRWDQRSTKDLELTGGAVPVTEGSGKTNWLDLEDGIQIQFQPSNVAGEANRYHTGDYWLIPARVATGDILWPQDIDPAGADKTLPRALEPHGIRHHYAPLWFIGDNDDAVPFDLRRKFGPLAVC